MSDNTILIGIDPGSTGAIAVYYPKQGVLVEKIDTETIGSLWEQVDSLIGDGWDGVARFCVIENVGQAHPGNAVGTATTFARHCGRLEMAVLAAGIPFELVRPKKWMDDVVPDRPRGVKDKKARKRYIYEAMCCRFPDTKVFVYNSDALAILAYLMDKKGVS